jgi:hypothetical protein
MSNRILLHPIKLATTPYTTPVGAAAGCDLLILLFADQDQDQDQKIAAFGSSYTLMTN